MPFRAFCSFIVAAVVVVAGLNLRRLSYTPSDAANPPYVDFGFEIAPQWNYYPLSMAIDGALTGFHLLVIVVLIAFHPFRAILLRRATFLFTIGQVLLGVQMISTRFPNPDEQAYPSRQWTYCMQSVQITLSMFLVTFYTRRRLLIVRWVYNATCLVSLWLLTTVHNLYTVDVLSGIFSAIVPFFVYHWYVRTAASIRKRPLLLRWFEGDALKAFVSGRSLAGSSRRGGLAPGEEDDGDCVTPPPESPGLQFGIGSVPRGTPGAPLSDASPITADDAAAAVASGPQTDVEMSVANHSLQFFDAAVSSAAYERASFSRPVTAGDRPSRLSKGDFATPARDIDAVVSPGMRGADGDPDDEHDHSHRVEPGLFWITGQRRSQHQGGAPPAVPHGGRTIPQEHSRAVSMASRPALLASAGSPLLKLGSPAQRPTGEWSPQYGTPLRGADATRGGADSSFVDYGPDTDPRSYVKLDPFSSSRSFADERVQRAVIASSAEHIRCELEQKFSSLKVRWYVTLLSTIFAGGIALGAALLNVLAANITNVQRPIDVPLPDDLLHRVLPTCPPHTPDYLLYPLVAGTFLFMVFSNHRLTYFRRLAVEYGFIMSVRFITLLATFPPDPSPICKTRVHPPGTTCGDMIFSGHTVAFLLATMMLLEHTGVWWIRAATVAYVTCSLVAIIASKLHYTRDVLTAIVVVMTTHHLLRVGLWLRSDVVACYRWLMVFEMDAYVPLDCDSWLMSPEGLCCCLGRRRPAADGDLVAPSAAAIEADAEAEEREVAQLRGGCREALSRFVRNEPLMFALDDDDGATPGDGFPI